LNNFYPTCAEVDERVSFDKTDGIYYKIRCGYCPTTDRDTWEELGNAG